MTLSNSENISRFLKRIKREEQKQIRNVFVTEFGKAEHRKIEKIKRRNIGEIIGTARVKKERKALLDPLWYPATTTTASRADSRNITHMAGKEDVSDLCVTNERSCSLFTPHFLKPMFVHCV